MSIKTAPRLELTLPQKRHIPSMRSLWKEAFGDGDAFLDIFFDTAFAPKRCRVAAVGDEVLGALYIFDCLYQNKKIAYIYAVATRKSARGQGICGKLMDDTHSYLRDNGYAGAILVPSEPSLFGFYEKLGYSTCSAIGEFCAEASENPACVEKIEKWEYASKRRQFLPQNSVLQEDVSVDFLATYASFYKGRDFLLAAYKNGSCLRGIELFGDPQSAPAILRALDCEKGSFRTPPGLAENVAVRPFAMYICLDKKTPSPEYFGLAFD